jgi:hypothetical protein
MYKLKEDGTHTLFSFKYDDYGDEIEEEISKGHKMV